MLNQEMGGLLRFKGCCRGKREKGTGIYSVPILGHGLHMRFIILTPFYNEKIQIYRGLKDLSNLRNQGQFWGTWGGSVS